MLRGDDVAELQQRLCALGFDSGRVDGIFGDDLGRAGRVPGNAGLPVDGIAGATTVSELLDWARDTRVGNRPFPTELENYIGERLRKIGGEFGATTGSPRRCGWLDAVSLRYSIRVNGIQKIAITKLDVLDEFKEIKVCTDFKFGGKS